MSIERREPPKFGVGVRVRVTEGTCTGWIGRISLITWYATLGAYVYDLVFEPATNPARFFLRARVGVGSMSFRHSACSSGRTGNLGAGHSSPGRPLVLYGARTRSVRPFGITSSQGDKIMHIGIFVLYGLFVTAEIAVLALMQSTGNFMGLFPAGLWMLVDVLVAVASMIVSFDPGYQAVLQPRLLLFHSVAFAAALAWMGVDAARDAHPLALIFFLGFLSMAMARVAQMILPHLVRRPLPWQLGIQTVAVCALTALLIASLLLPVPPSAAGEQRFSPMLGDPAPPVALASSEVRS